MKDTASTSHFPELSSLINYDLYCLTAKIRRGTNRCGIVFFKHMQDTFLSIVFFYLIRWTEVLFSQIVFFFTTPFKIAYEKACPALLSNHVVTLRQDIRGVKVSWFDSYYEVRAGILSHQTFTTTQGHTHTDKHTEIHRAICQDILPGGGSMPSISLALRLGQPIPCCLLILLLSLAHIHIHMLASLTPCRGGNIFMVEGRA